MLDSLLYSMVLVRIGMKRDSSTTRQRLLRAAFREFQANGYRASDLERILSQAGVTKGALYYHFKSKRGLGYAVIEEVLRDFILHRWLDPLKGVEDPLTGLADLARWGERWAQPEEVAMGCPLLTLSQELGGVDEGFRQRLAAIYSEWRDGLMELLLQAQNRGVVRSDLDARAAATFIIGAWQGSIGLAKPLQTPETLRLCRQSLGVFLQALRPRLQGVPSLDR